MQFSDITGAIHDAWTFLWPPFFMLLIAYLCSKLLNPEGTKDFLVSIWGSMKESSTQLEAFRQILDTYGLAKLIPLTSLIGVISVLYLLNGPVTILSSKLPPNFSYVPSVIVERSGSDELLLLLRKYPTSDSIGQAYSFAQEELIDRSKVDRYNRVQIHYKIQNFIKFAILCLFLFSILHLLHGAGFLNVLVRFVAGAAVVVVIWCFSLVPFLYNQEQSFRDDWRTIQISLQSEAKLLLAEPPNDDEKAILDSVERPYSNSWWRVHFFDTTMIDWAKRNIVRSKL